MVREGKLVRSRTGYILGTDRCLFWNVSVWDPRQNNDHYMVLGCLRSAPKREHARYLTGRKKLPLRPPYEPTREDGIFTALRRAVPKPHTRERGNEGRHQDALFYADNGMLVLSDPRWLHMVL